MEMKKVISDVVNFPNGCETVRFTACLVSMLMRAEGITDKDCDFFCGKQKEVCIRCGQCKDLIPINKKADCFAFVRDHDEFMLDELKKGFE